MKTQERKLKHHACDSCEVLYINGLKCHEQGCPDSWKDEIRECDWCGQNFKPEERHNAFCSQDCLESYTS